MLGDQPIDVAGEGLEALQRIDWDHLDPATGVHQWRMPPETQVDDGAITGHCVFDEWPDEAAIIADLVDPPDHVVAGTQIVEHEVEAAQSGGDPLRIGWIRHFGDTRRCRRRLGHAPLSLRRRLMVDGWARDGRRISRSGAIGYPDERPTQPVAA